MGVRVILADDHALFRKGLSLLIKEQTDWEVVGEASDGDEAIVLAEQLQPQIVILDLEMPRMNGLEAVRALRQRVPAAGIIVLSSYSDRQYLESAFSSGALAYVLKNEAMDDLVGAVDAALRMRRFISPALSQSPPAVERRSVEIDKDLLSRREQDVLRLLSEGCRTKEIAQLLNISTRTVETYRSRLMLKLGIKTLPGLVKFALRAGIAKPGD